MANRKFRDVGIAPVLGYPLFFAGFIVLSLYLFYKTEFAPYIYILIAIGWMANLSETRRNDFLKTCYEEYRKIRVVENLIISLPFILFFVIKMQFFASFFLVFASIALGLFSFNTSMDYVIPTPFSKKPFEFTTGFRNTFILILLAYVITVIAMITDNYNLGIFSMLLIFLTSFSYYVNPENEYYVWAFSLNPKQFLLEKIKTAMAYVFYLCSPILLALLIFYSKDLFTTLAFCFLGFSFLVTIILAKYSAYPNQMNLPQGLLIGISIYFPPLILLAIPLFYFQSVRKLKLLLK